MDALLARLTYEPEPPEITPIPWPEGFAPKPYDPRRGEDVPQADVIAMCWTSAEAAAMAAVFTPGIAHTDWTPYTADFASYEHELTYRSPAKEAHCLGHFCLVGIGGLDVLVFQSELHLATDAVSLPLRRMLGQLFRAVGPAVVIDSGTAGGIGPNVVVGDTVVAENLRFDCTGFLRDESYAHRSFACTAPVPTDWTMAYNLMATNAHLLPPNSDSEFPLQVLAGDVLTCDSFLFDDAENTYGLRTYDPAALAEEMDAATLGLVAEDLGLKMPAFASLRSVSDPQMPNEGVRKEEQAASKIYERYGFAAQLATAIAVWQVIAELKPAPLDPPDHE